MRSSLRRKNSTKIFIAAALIAAVAFGVSNYFIDKANEVVVAKVNDQKILKSEVEAKLRSAFEGQNIGGQNQELKIPEIENLPKEVLEILAKEIYLDKEINKLAKKSAAGKSSEIKAQIEENKNRILRQAYLDSILKEEITDQKISDKYAELSNELTGKKEYLVSHIVTKTKEEAEKIAKDLKAKKPLSFAEAAKKYSIDPESAIKGGELGFVLEDNMLKEISTAINSLKVGEVSNPIQTNFGWHLIKYSESREAKAIPFESAKFNIRNQLIQNKINEINSAITKDAKIQILITPKEVEKPTETPAAETKTNDVQPAAETNSTDVQLQSESEINKEQKPEEVKAEDEKAAAAEEEKVEKSQETTDAKQKKSKSKKKHK
jgi:parvulin-like peptidyl-prolyl isomerase